MEWSGAEWSGVEWSGGAALVSRLSGPLTPLVLLPAEMLTRPPRPAGAAPLPILIAQLLPFLDVPKEKISMPITQQLLSLPCGSQSYPS